MTFTKVFDKQRRLYSDNARIAIQETIRICREQNVLKEYLEGEEAAAAEADRAFFKIRDGTYSGAS